MLGGCGLLLACDKVQRQETCSSGATSTSSCDRRELGSRK